MADQPAREPRTPDDTSRAAPREAPDDTGARLAADGAAPTTGAEAPTEAAATDRDTAASSEDDAADRPPRRDDESPAERYRDSPGASLLDPDADEFVEPNEPA